MDLQSLIQPELLALVPLLSALGTMLKRRESFPDEKIPLTLGGVSIAVAVLYVFATVPLGGVQSILHALLTGLLQGVLCAGASVYAHQLMCQSRKGRDKETAQKE